jgi:DNA-binding SARP family transcriptional activator
VGFEYRILGPLEVARDGQAVRLGGRKQRMLLALLVLEARAPVPPDRLIEALCQDYDPAASGRLQVMVSLLRKALGDRDAITMRRLAADLALGRERELVPELEALVSEHPLSERLRAALMLALYRAGRQADALDALLAARRTLVDGWASSPVPRCATCTPRSCARTARWSWSGPRSAPAAISRLRRRR